MKVTIPASFLTMALVAAAAPSLDRRVTCPADEAFPVCCNTVQGLGYLLCIGQNPGTSCDTTSIFCCRFALNIVGVPLGYYREGSSSTGRLTTRLFLGNLFPDDAPCSNSGDWMRSALGLSPVFVWRMLDATDIGLGVENGTWQLDLGTGTERFGTLICQN
jgi:hypothetical protein